MCFKIQYRSFLIMKAINSFKDEFLKIIDQININLSLKPSWLSDECRIKTEKPILQINITGTFTVEPVKPYLEFWLGKFGITPSITFPGYNQIFTQLLNPGSEFNSNHDGYNVLLLRFEDWIKDKIADDPVSEFNKKIEEIENALATAFQINSGGEVYYRILPSITPAFEGYNPF